MLRQLLPFVVVSAALALSGCRGGITVPGPEQHESRSIEVGKAERVRVELKMPAGELEVRGGAQDLLNADFSYNVASWKPEIRYRLTGSTGDLVLEQPGAGAAVGDAKNHWDLRLNDGVPMDLRVDFGAGEARLNLGSLDLQSVDLDMGAGKLMMDLRGTPKKDYSVRVRGGVGEATVYLPKEIGISAAASGGIGEISVTGLQKSGDRYVNDAFERSGVRIRVDVQGGVGSIKLIAE
jgi:hypothetical protein